MSFFRVNEKCNGCLSCVQNCPNRALDHRDRDGKRTILHSISLCARCGQCWRICPQGAVEFRYLLESDFEEVVVFDLILCSICGEPICTPAFGEKVSARLRIPLDETCPRHRREKQMVAWSCPGQKQPLTAGGAS